MQAEWDAQAYHTNALDSGKVNHHLDNSIGDVQWLPNISASGENCIVHAGKFPPLAPKTNVPGVGSDLNDERWDGSSKGQEETANALGFSVAERMHIFGVQQEQAITMFLQIVGP
ncbi:unnamed protein product [Sphagnum jensenii]|uniref:Uncharacterized protein n=1 Tax=Sphagnum jensenii TaxID=128206 RepID=A0ABP0XC04_9BRYO